MIGPILNDVLAWFRRQGYTEHTIHNHLKATSRLFRWLQKRRSANLRVITQRNLSAAYEHFRGRRVDVASVSRALGRFLAEHELIPAERPKAPSPTERQIQLFGSYLNEMRGLAPSTVIGHQRRIRLFLKFLNLDECPSAIRNLKLDHIESFLRYSAKTNNRFSGPSVIEVGLLEFSPKRRIRCKTRNFTFRSWDWNRLGR